MWGEWNWVRAESETAQSGNNGTWYIKSESIRHSGQGYEFAEYVTGITKESENVIRLELNSQTFNGTHFLFPKRIAGATFSGKVAELVQTSPSVLRSVAGGKGWATVVVENLDNGSKIDTQTDGDGNFVADGIIPGDEYKVTPEGGTSVVVTPNADGDDVGTITVTDGLNFKVSGESKSPIMLANDINSYGLNYSCTLSIKNIGTETASACTYQINGDEGETYSGVLGSIKPNETKTIDITIRCGAIAGEKRFKKLNVVINDPINNKTWNDSASFLFYKSTVAFTFMSDKKKEESWTAPGFISGCIITPEHISYNFASSYDTKQIIVPRLHGNYLIAVVTSTREVIYGIDSDIFATHIPDSEFKNTIENFTGTANYEPNDSETTAKLITEPVMAYLHNGDLDYYLVKIE
jgi:hypothetical protein